MKSDFVIGIGVGVGLGLLFAHQSGDKTRADIRKIVKESLDESTAAATKLGNRAKDVAREGKDRVADALEAGNQALRTQMAGS